MPVISKFLGIDIKMYFREHNPPHFHAVYQNYKAVFDIKTCKMVEGKFPKRQRQFVEVWAYLHRDELQTNRQMLQERHLPDSIPPLRK